MARPDLALLPGGGNPVAVQGRLADELAGYFRMRRLLEPGMAAEACRTFRPHELDRLEARIPLFTSRTDRDDTARREFEIELVRPVATPWDLRVLNPAWDDAGTLSRTVLDPDGRELTRYRLACHGLIAAYRTRNPVAVRAASVSYLDRAEQVVRLLAAAP